MSGSSLVKQIAMTIVADDGDAQSKIADLSAKGDELAKPHSLKITADTGEATGEVDAVTEALARYDESAAKAAQASEHLAQVQAESGASAADVQAAADANTDAVLRERQAWLSLGEAQTAEAIKARESAAAQQESAAKTDAAGVSASGAHGKLGLLALGAGGVALASLDMGLKFEEASTQLVTGAGQSEAGLAKVEQGMLSVSTQTATSSEQIQSGMYMIESAGYHGANGLLVLKAAAEGAKVGNADLGTVADATTTILTDYRMKAGDAASATSGLVAVVASGKTHMGDLANALSKVLPTAAALKVPFDQVGGAMATMTGEGVTARLAATHLNSTLLALANPSKTAATAMEGVGLSSTKVANTLSHGGLVAALQLVTDAAGKKFPVGSAGYVAAVDKMLGGQAGLATALELTGKHLGTLKGNTDSVSESMRKGGKDVEGWGDVQKDASFKVDQAKTAAKNLGTSIGLDLLPAVTKILTPIASFAEHISESKGEAEALAGVVGGALALYVGVKAVGAFKTLGDNVSAVYHGFQQVGSGIAGLIGKLTGASAETEALTVAQEGQAAATEGAAAAQEGLDVAMDANPVGAIILALTLLVGGIVLVVTHLKDFEQWGKDAFRFVEAAAEDTWDWVKAHWPLLLAILTGPIGLAVLWIKDHWKEITTDAGTVVHDVASWFGKLPGMIIHGLENLGEMMYHAGVHAIEQLISGISSMIGSLGSVMGHVVEGPLSGGGAPEIRGQHIAADIAAGMISGQDAVLGASRQLAQATMAGYSGGSSRPVAGAAGSYGGATIENHFHFDKMIAGDPQGIAREVQTMLKTLKRRNGGAPLGLD